MKGDAATVVGLGLLFGVTGLVWWFGGPEMAIVAICSWLLGAVMS